MNETVKLWTCRVFRDFPELRYVSKRDELIDKVKELGGKELKERTIDRMARHIQNKLGLYQVEDNRDNLEVQHREYYGGIENETTNKKKIF